MVDSADEFGKLPDVALSAQARDTLVAAARGSLHTERGGLLVGFRNDYQVVVEDAVEVADTTAGRATYLRRDHHARLALDAYLVNSGDDGIVGYVGEWHTHPMPVPPSPIDHQAMRTMVRKGRGLVILIVAALQHDGRSVDIHALIGDPRSLRDRITGRHTDAVVGVE